MANAANSTRIDGEFDAETAPTKMDDAGRGEISLRSSTEKNLSTTA